MAWVVARVASNRHMRGRPDCRKVWVQGGGVGVGGKV